MTFFISFVNFKGDLCNVLLLQIANILKKDIIGANIIINHILFYGYTMIKRNLLLLLCMGMASMGTHAIEQESVVVEQKNASYEHILKYVPSRHFFVDSDCIRVCC